MKSRLPLRESGQALIEFLASFGLLVLTVVGAATLWRAQWEHARCAYLVFETAHAARAGRAGPWERSGTGKTPAVTVVRDRETTRATGRCGESRESVVLPDLEASGW